MNIMNWLRNQRIGRKFSVLFGCVIALIVFNTIGMIEIAKTGYLQFLEREHIELALLMRNSLERARQEVQQTGTFASTEWITADAEKRDGKGLRPLLAEILIQPQACLQSVNGVELSVFRALGFGKAFDLCEKDIRDITDADRIITDFLNKKVEPTAFITNFDEKLNEIEDQSREFSLIIPAARNMVRRLVLSATAVFSLFVLGMFILIAQIVRMPVKILAQRIKEIAEGEGDLTKRLDIISRDEIGETAQWFNLFVDKLQEMILKVTLSASNVAAGSRQMSSSATQMSQGASAQASATEEASSSMEQMSVNIRQNTDNALQTEKIAIKVAEDAKISGEAVAETVSAMQEISKRVALIDDIARQTRMLSLNATIEAARAQEQGKGFAVVASEVRALSERSQTAASEIAELVGSSAAIAEKAGGMLKKLVPEIQRTAELVKEISAASREQSSGIEQINRAIQQLDNVTQQNSATSEEIAATAEELSAQAEQLQQTMTFFRIAHAESSLPSAETTSPRPPLAIDTKPPTNQTTPPTHADAKKLHDDGFERF